MSRSCGWGLICLGLFACRTPGPAPAPVPVFTPRVVFFPGTGLGGPHYGPDAPISDDPADALALSVELLYVERAHADDLDRIGASSRLILGVPAPSMLLPSGNLSREVRIGRGDEARDFLERMDRGELGAIQGLGDERVALPRGVTFGALFPTSDEDGAPRWDPRRVSLYVSHTPSGEVEVALSLSGIFSTQERVTPTELRETAGSLFRRVEEPRRELVVLDTDCLQVGGVLVVLVPFTAAEGNRRVFAISCQLERAPESGSVEWEEHLLRVGRTFEGFAGSASTGDWIGTMPEGPATEQRFWEESAAALRESTGQRADLARMAQLCGADLTADLALVAEEELLAELVPTLPAEALGWRAGYTPTAWREAVIGWSLEKSALQLILRRYAESELSPEVAALLALHTGEAWRLPGRLEDVIEASADKATYMTGMAELNIEQLDDLNPGARVRAFDWLEAQGFELGAYDPLASGAERRAALDALMEARAK